MLIGSSSSTLAKPESFSVSWDREWLNVGDASKNEPIYPSTYTINYGHELNDLFSIGLYGTKKVEEDGILLSCLGSACVDGVYDIAIDSEYGAQLSMSLPLSQRNSLSASIGISRINLSTNLKLHYFDYNDNLQSETFSFKDEETFKTASINFSRDILPILSFSLGWNLLNDGHQSYGSYGAYLNGFYPVIDFHKGGFIYVSLGYNVSEVRSELSTTATGEKEKLDKKKGLFTLAGFEMFLTDNGSIYIEFGKYPNKDSNLGDIFSIGYNYTF